MFDDNPIIVDVNSYKSKKKLKILCVLCKLPLDCINSPEDLRYKCPRCKNIYQLGYEILEHEDDIESSHEDEDVELSGLGDNDSVGLLVATDNEFTTTTEEENNNTTTRSNIPIPDYMKAGPGKRLVEFKEIIEED